MPSALAAAVIDGNQHGRIFFALGERDDLGR
jgi:hypothetical protein